MIHDATMWFYPVIFASVWLSPIAFVVNLILELLGVLV